MNREIKFRGCRPLNGEWVYGNLMIKQECSPVPETTELYTACYIVPFDGLDYYECEVLPSTIGQYTGLKDKDGKEIYEGDIITSVFEEDGKESVIFDFEVIFQEGAFLALIDYDLTTHSLTELNELEVIGNIHENPELMKL